MDLELVAKAEEENVRGPVAEEDGADAAVVLPQAVHAHLLEGVHRVLVQVVLSVVLKKHLNALKGTEKGLGGAGEKGRQTKATIGPTGELLISISLQQVLVGAKGAEHQR